MKEKQTIVIVSGGFAGLTLLRRLNKNLYDVVLVDKNNFHGFPPLFYQIASCGLDAGSISFPFRRELRKGRARGANYRLGEVKKVDTVKQTVETQYETIHYDKLIIAAGTTNNFFGNPDLVERVFTLKSASEALRIRDEVLQRLELAALEHDEEARKKLLSFTVIGGGATGVEMAGALGEMRRYILPREYSSIPQKDVCITLVEGTGALLGAMSEKAHEKSMQYLEELGVNVVLKHFLKNYEGMDATLDDGSVILSGMLIWTAGITAQKICFNGFTPQLAKGNRMEVDECNRVVGSENIYAVGDIAYMATKTYPNGHPQLAQVAIQQSHNLAKNLNKQFVAPKPFVYKDKGTMATIGRNRAVADIKNIKLSGRVAWLAWMFVHLMSILGMRNKLSVLINWIWAYCTYSTSLREIIRPNRYPLRHEE